MVARAVFWLVIPSLVILALPGRANAVRAADPVDFTNDIRPVLARRCFVCHGPDVSTRRAGVRLDTRDHATAMLPDARGAAIVPGNPDASLLLQRVRETDPDRRMPPGHDPLDADTIEQLERWIADGAPYAEHWSWVPVANPAAPHVRDPDWVRRPLDAFILARLEAAGLEPAPEADRATLLRRLSFDLIGLPPTIAELDAFLDDDAPDAWERQVDRLLASPRFGERWGRHWLDLMRYAETYGHEFDYPIHHAHEYRDYVIRAFNAGVPYDVFVTEHLAGDLVDTPRRHPTDGTNESILGTGWWYLGQGTHGPVDVRQDEIDRVDNQIDVLSKTFLGVTAACARCHDHKFDAITAADYYALAGFSRSSRRQVAYLDPGNRIAEARVGLLALMSQVDESVDRAILADRDQHVDDITRYAAAAREARTGTARDGDPPLEVMHADFEGDDYGDWRAEGEAFGPGPSRQSLLPARQGNVGAIGQGLVTSHFARAGEDGRAADAYRGRLIGPTFTVDQPYIHFRIGGGQHPNRVCLNLVVDDAVARTATGHNNNAMRDDRFDVRDLVGREARFEIVDDVDGGWGHISVDAIGLGAGPDRRTTGRPVETVAREQGLDRDRLHRWFAAMTESWPSPPMSVARCDPRLEPWTATGHAFASGDPAFVPRTGHDDTLGARGPAVVHSGTIASRLRGTTRSATFTIDEPFIHLLLSGTGGRARLIIDHYHLDEFNALLFEGLIQNVQNADTAVHRRFDVSRYRGHHAYIEITDDGDGWIALDGAWFGSGDQGPDWQRTDEPDDLVVASAIDTVRAWTTRPDLDPVRGWLLRHELLDLDVADWGRRALAEARRIDAELALPRRAVALTDGSPDDEYLLYRGDHRQARERIPRRFIESLSPDGSLATGAGSGRLDLARRVMADDNPLTSRVAVNRLWHHLLGRGIVSTTDDFGALGQPPTHPLLLDHLAHRFRIYGWSTKMMIREIVTSSTYRMSSAVHSDRAETTDPNNDLLHRARVRRLQGEAIRDAILAISGRLDDRMYGAPVPVHLTEFMSGRGRPGRSGPLDGEGRRSIYLSVRRNFLPPMMLAFDTPLPSSAIGCRTVSNVPAQALILMNDPFVVAEAKRWAEATAAIDEGPVRLDTMFREAIGRSPTDAEAALCAEFVYDSEDPNAAWADLGHVILNLKSFSFLQ